MGEKIRLARVTRRWPQAHLARFAGRSGGWLSLVEHGQIEPRVVELERLANALGIEVRALLPDKDTAR